MLLLAGAMGSTVGASARAPLLLQAQLQALNDNRYVAIKNWISNAQTDELMCDALAVRRFGGTYDCHIGDSAGGVGSVHDPSVRNSRMCTLYPPPSNSAGSVDVRARLTSIVDRLRRELQASSVLALPYLEPFQTELHYLLYPVGGHYKRHLDTGYQARGWKLLGRQASDGGSLRGGRTRRVISFLIYLNRGWDQRNGGELRVFPPLAPDDPARTRQPTGRHELDDFTEDIVPEGGTLVLLASADVEHLVRETFAERQCVVGWFREYHEERVPDLDPSSLRTRPREGDH